MIKKTHADLEVSCSAGPHGLNPYFVTVPGFLVEGRRIKGARFGVHKPFTVGVGYAKPVMQDLGWVLVEISSGRRVTPEDVAFAKSAEAALNEGEARSLTVGGGPGLKKFWEYVRHYAHERYLLTKPAVGLRFKKTKLNIKTPEPEPAKPVLRLKSKMTGLQLAHRTPKLILKRK